MIVTFSRLGQYGRLGNQLFQIASTMGIAHHNGMDFKFPRWEHRNHFPGFIQLRCDLDVLPSGQYYDYQDIPYKEVQLDPTQHWDLFGYFQSEKYFEAISHQIVQAFKSNSMEIITDRVAIHVRRGDYLQRSDHHINLGIDYYLEAMERFPGKEFTIFSDEIGILKKWFPHAEFVAPGNPVTDLFHMASHTGFITANSTYSWWGAWLAEHIHPVDQIIAPRRWFVHLDSQDLIPDRWLRI